jgi:thiol-disulfide isomerase/thioredoxin
MKNLLTALFLLTILTPTPSHGQTGHEYAALEEKTVNYKNWILKDLRTNQPIDLRTIIHGKKLVMVVYFASWCPNWRFEAPVASRLYKKYRDQGFEVIAVSEYGSRDDARAFFGPEDPPYSVVFESESRDDRDKTSHYNYRQLTGDKRKWGSPWNIFLEPSKLNKEGDLLTERAWIVNGELIEAEVENFISERVKLTARLTDPLPQFSLAALNGQTVTSQELKDSIVVIDFWATWCEGCITEIPAFNRLEQKYAPRGVKVIGLAVQSGWAKDIRRFAKLYKMRYTLLVGNDDIVSDYGVISFPATYVIAPGWKLHKKYLGVSATKAADIQRDIETLLEAKR